MDRRRTLSKTDTFFLCVCVWLEHPLCQGLPSNSHTHFLPTPFSTSQCVRVEIYWQNKTVRCRISLYPLHISFCIVVKPKVKSKIKQKNEMFHVSYSPHLILEGPNHGGQPPHGRPTNRTVVGG